MADELEQTEVIAEETPATEAVETAAEGEEAVRPLRR